MAFYVMLARGEVSGTSFSYKVHLLSLVRASFCFDSLSFDSLSLISFSYDGLSFDSLSLI